MLTNSKESNPERFHICPFTHAAHNWRSFERHAHTYWKYSVQLYEGGGGGLSKGCRGNERNLNNTYNSNTVNSPDFTSLNHQTLHRLFSLGNCQGTCNVLFNWFRHMQPRVMSSSGMHFKSSFCLSHSSESLGNKLLLRLSDKLIDRFVAFF